MAWKWYIVSFLIVLLRWSFKGVLSQIDISPTSAFVDAGNELTFSCTRTSSTWFSFYYIINGAVCFLTFPTADPCHAGITSCSPLQSNSYSYSCDKIHFNLTIINVQRSMQNTSVIGSMGVAGSALQTDEVIIQVNVPLTSVTVVPNGMLTLIEGDTRQLTCSAVSIPPATLSWSLDGSPTATSSPPDINDDTVTSIYSYTPRKQDNDKTVKCTASYGSVQYTDNVTLNIQYLPNVEITPSIYDPYQVIENVTNLQLMCAVIDTNPGVSSYSWYKDGSNLPEKTANYTISTVRRSDSGGYSCDATNPVGTSSMSTVVRLDVFFGITLDVLRPQQVIRGSKLDVPCTGQSNPPITDDNVRWTKQTNNTFTQTGRHLTIINVNKADTGIYICTVDITLIPSIGPNIQKSATVPLHVEILYLPTVEVKPSAYNPYKVIENTTDLQLSCSVIDSNPGVTSYRWYKENSIITTSTANYTIPTVRKSDTGRYSCDATNMVGNSAKSMDVKLDVMYGVIMNTIQDQQVKENTSLVILNCTGDSNPAVKDGNVSWTKQGNATFSSNRKLLIIKNINRFDTGKFVCNISLSLIPSVGETVVVSDSIHVSVDVLCNTRLDTSNDLPNMIGIKTNEDLNITIYLIGNPKPDIIWSFRTSDTGQSTTLSNVVIKSLGFHLYVTHYSKTPVLTSDYGFYTIEASNRNERAFRHTLEVKQAREPYNPSNIVVVCDTTSMIAVWQSGFNGGSAQIFYVIWISLDTNVTSRSVGILDPGQGNFEHFKTKSLEPDCNYRVYIESSNEYGRSRSNAISNCTTSTDTADICVPRDKDGLSFSAGIGVGLVLVVVCESTILGIICIIKRKQTNLAEKTKIYESTKNTAGPANIYNELNEETKDEQSELTTRHNNTYTPNMYDDVMAYDNQETRSEGKKGPAKGSAETQIVGGIYMNTEI